MSPQSEVIIWLVISHWSHVCIACAFYRSAYILKFYTSVNFLAFPINMTILTSTSRLVTALEQEKPHLQRVRVVNRSLTGRWPKVLQALTLESIVWEGKALRRGRFFTSSCDIMDTTPNLHLLQNKCQLADFFVTWLCSDPSTRTKLYFYVKNTFAFSCFSFVLKKFYVSLWKLSRPLSPSGYVTLNLLWSYI